MILNLFTFEKSFIVESLYSKNDNWKRIFILANVNKNPPRSKLARLSPENFLAQSNIYAVQTGIIVIKLICL